MAKFVTVGYGSNGQGTGSTNNGYTYVVNDNVRVGRKVTVPVVHAGMKPTVFATTGRILSTTKSADKARTAMEADGKGDVPIAEAETPRHARGTGGKGGYSPLYMEEVSRGKAATQRAWETSIEVSQGQATQRAVETYDEYIKQFGD